MKSITVYFETHEFETLKKVKGEKTTWHDFIMTLTEVKENVET